MSREYFNQRATVWDETVSEKDASKLERMCQHLDIKPGSTLLDVGTGTGVLIPYLSGKVGKSGRIVALDFAEEMLKIARSKGFGGNIDYLCADITSVPIGDAVFDYVVCYSSFPHFNTQQQALAEISRVTKSGGRLFICHTIGRERLNQIHRQMPVVAKDLLPDESEMRKLLHVAGFTDIVIEDDRDSYLASARKT